MQAANIVLGEEALQRLDGVPAANGAQGERYAEVGRKTVNG